MADNATSHNTARRQARPQHCKEFVELSLIIVATANLLSPFCSSWVYNSTSPQEPGFTPFFPTVDSVRFTERREGKKKKKRFFFKYVGVNKKSTRLCKDADILVQGGSRDWSESWQKALVREREVGFKTRGASDV